MPVIRVSDKTMDRLKMWAEPLVDTAESALSKVLDAAEQAQNHPGHNHQTRVAEPTRATRRHTNSKNQLPQKEYEQPLLELIYEQGGSARVADLQQLMKEKMKSALLPGDLESVSSGESRWWNTTRWARRSLVQQGYLRDDSTRGTWELSEKGTELAAGALSKAPLTFVEHLLVIPDVGDDADFDREQSGPRGIEF